MSIYGSNPSRSTWQFDGIFSTYDEMFNAKDSILYGRHVFLIQSDGDYKAGVYQKTDNTTQPFIFLGDITALNLSNIVVEPNNPYENKGEIIADEDGNATIKLTLNSLRALENLSIERTSLLTVDDSQEPIIQFYNFPETNPGSTSESGNYTPSITNGFDLKGDGVTVKLIKGTPTARAQVILTAAPTWKQFPTTAAESVTINYDDAEDAVTLSNMNYNYDSQSDTLIATIEDESDNA